MSFLRHREQSKGLRKTQASLLRSQDVFLVGCSPAEPTSACILPPKCKPYSGLTYFCKHRLGLAIKSVNFFQDDTNRSTHSNLHIGTFLICTLLCGEFLRKISDLIRWSSIKVRKEYLSPHVASVALSMGHKFYPMGHKWGISQP